MYAVSKDNEEAAEDEVVQEATASDKEEVAPESYKQAVLDPRVARVDADGSQGVAEQRMLAGVAHSERSKTNQVEICVQLAWSSDQAQVQTSVSRFPST